MESTPPTNADPADPVNEAMRIQVAAVVAQQAALTEKELRLHDRETALARQEEQLAARLEDDRRQLLELQDQITEARSALRRKRAAHAALAEQQARELAHDRAEAAEHLSEAKAERLRLTTLRRRMIQRWRRHWTARRKEIEAQEAHLKRERERVAAERFALFAKVKHFHGQAELDKRQLREEWSRLTDERQSWQSERTEGEAAQKRETRDLARRAKAIAAAERRLTTEQAAQEKQLADRRHELDHLEVRIANARDKLLERQGEALQLERSTPGLPALFAASIFPTNSPPPTAWSPALVDLEQREAALTRRGEVFARVADELADQRWHLAEQSERLRATHETWCAERAAAMQEMEALGAQFQEREQELDIRDHELQTMHDRLHGESKALAELRLRLDAERLRDGARDADRMAELSSLQSVLVAREVVLTQRESKLANLYRQWGRRRILEIRRLRFEQEACRQERAEWAAARAVWLHAGERLREERRAVTAQALAVEQWRQECLGNAAGPPGAATKRLERLRRQWSSYCAGAARELERLRATVETEAVRIDERSRCSRRAHLTVAIESARLDGCAAEVERGEVQLAAERLMVADVVARESLAREQAEKRAADLRDDVDRLARLLIDAPQTESTCQAA